MLAEAGLTLVGENRAQELAAKAERAPRAALHFIGQLQSRKVKHILPQRAPHPLRREGLRAPAAQRHGTPQHEILVEVNVAGEASKAGVAPEELGGVRRARSGASAGPMTTPPFASAAGDSRRHFAALRELADAHELRAAVDGHLAGLRGRRRGGRDDRTCRHAL